MEIIKVKWGQKGRALIWSDSILVRRYRKQLTFSPPRVDMARRWLSASQEESTHRNPTPQTLNETYSLQNWEKISFCSLIQFACGYFILVVWADYSSGISTIIVFPAIKNLSGSYTQSYEFHILGLKAILLCSLDSSQRWGKESWYWENICTQTLDIATLQIHVITHVCGCVCIYISTHIYMQYIHNEYAQWFKSGFALWPCHSLAVCL